MHQGTETMTSLFARVSAWTDWPKLRRLLRYTSPHRLTLGLALTATLLTSLLGLVFPALVGRLLDGALLKAGPESSAALNGAVLLLVAVFVLRAISGAVQGYLLMSVGESVVRDLRGQLYTHLLRLPQSFFDARRSGDLNSRLTGDILTVQGVVSDTLSVLVGQLFTLAGGLVVLLRISLPLSALMLSVIPLVLLAAALFGRQLEQLSRQLRAQEATASAHAQESFVNIRVVKSFVTEAAESAAYRDLTSSAFAVALMRARVRASYGPAVGMLMACSVSLVLWWGGHLVQRGGLSAGTLIAFLLYTVTVTNALQALSGVHGQVREAVGASAEVFALLDESPAVQVDTEQVDTVQVDTEVTRSLLSAVTGHLRFEDVSFRYAPGLPLVLDHLNFEVQAGEVVAIVGPSGAGKSSVADLLLRLYDPVGGQIVLDGQALETHDLQALRRATGVVPQETQLFAASLRDNLRYGSPQATQSETEEAVRAAQLEGVVASLPDGYDTLIGERGITLSGGQRQRVAIARALLRDPRLLILDEATSALDSESERLVQQALDTLMRGRTTVVIAHRLFTVRRAHQILVLDRGQIVQRGTHDALMAEPGLYRLLLQQQALAPEV
jgi:ATP-binding cassette, subfamily B, bacterial MsbA